MLTTCRCFRDVLSRTTTRLLLFTVGFAPAITHASTDREAALLAGDGDVPAFLRWLGLVAAICAVGAIIAAVVARRMRRRDALKSTEARLSSGDLSTATCLTIAAAILLGALSVSALVSDVLAVQLGLKAASSESGPLEITQTILWLLSAATALLSVFWLRDGESRGALLLLGGGALLAAAREADLHEKLNPQAIGEWGVRFRGDWWFSTTSPVLPRILWAVVAIVIAVVGIYILRRGGPALLVRGRRHGRLVPLLALVAFLMFLGFGFDDLLRYRPGINLRQSQVCEETIELAAPMVYLAALVWGIRLGLSANQSPVNAGDSNPK